MLCLILFLSIIYSVHGGAELPERARGGRAWKERNAMLKTKVGGECETKTWQATLDHFSDDKTTFSQRYFVVSDYFKEGSPVFLYIGGEGTASCPSGYVTHLAQNYSAMVVTLEHRYYGKSVPNDNSYTENLKYLTVQNALADLNTFTKYFLNYKNLTDTTKVFAFGGSYPGGLASWYRISYPQASVGSLSSSGVVDVKADYPEFDQAVSAAVSNACADRIRKLQKSYEDNVSQGKLQESLSSFNCEKDMSVQDFYYMIADSWSMAVQYSSKSQLCSAILSVDEDATPDVLMSTFSEFSKEYWGDDFCTGGFYNTKALADPKRWDTNSRSWRYQTCAQVGWFNTAPKSGSLRGETVNLKYHLDQCAEVFKIPNMFPDIKGMRKEFGGDTPTASQVFYSDFSDDPWAKVSVQYPVTSSQPYKMAMANDLGHCSDLHEPSDSDSDALKEERAEFEQYLYKWLSL